jgi:hypothetical protein
MKAKKSSLFWQTIAERQKENIADLMSQVKRLRSDLEAEKLLTEAATANHTEALSEIDMLREASMEEREELERLNNKLTNYAWKLMKANDELAEMPASDRKRRMDDRI